MKGQKKTKALTRVELTKQINGLRDQNSMLVQMIQQDRNVIQQILEAQESSRLHNEALVKMTIKHFISLDEKLDAAALEAELQQYFQENVDAYNEMLQKRFEEFEKEQMKKVKELEKQLAEDQEELKKEFEEESKEDNAPQTETSDDDAPSNVIQLFDPSEPNESKS